MTKQTYGQDLPYVQWRAKQNFDYAYLMRYSASLSNYYVQLEDDVITAPAYVTSMRQYIDDQKDAWTCLEFSELGFIGIFGLGFLRLLFVCILCCCYCCCCECNC